MNRFHRLRRALSAFVLGPSATTNDAMTSERMLRAWNMAPKSEVPAHFLLRNASDDLGRLFLGLALAFNDLKGMALLDQYLLAMRRPEPSDWSARAGQWRGVAVQLHRWIGGVIHEVMVLIQKNRDLISGKVVQWLVVQLGTESRQAWNELVEAALDTSGKASQLLLRIRNSAAFHYDAKSLAQGFLKQFQSDAKSDPTEANRAPQYSIGQDMDGTRFFYADAAAQQTLMTLGLQHDAPETDRHVIELAGKVNEALVPLIHAFIESRRSSV